MELQLVKATENDAHALHDLQVKAFMPLLNKYKDFETNPANEPIEKVISKINQNNSGFYKIVADHTLKGAIRVFWREGDHFWISPIFILRHIKEKELPQKVVALVGSMFLQAITWELATILEEKQNCYLYEKMGYKKMELVRN